MAIKSETRLGPYEIVSAIGAGGMGEVYRARDPRLKREVAIKVLPASFSGDPERLHRFEQEAIAAGALNHPNILAVHDIGTQDGSPYIVSELLDGATLRERLRSGPLPVRKAIDYGQQIATGLAAAHDKGIIHRDLKPENIFITNDGRVKILDFGLAKLTRVEGSEDQALTQTIQSDPGIVLGTVGYMSPEQVRGKPADARSDLFSFGTVLYEMISGKRAFKGDSSADIVSAILKEEPPDVTGTNPDASPAVERVVRHCLEKNPAERFQSAKDLSFALSELSTDASGAFRIAGIPRRTPLLLWASIGLAVIVAAVVTWFAPRRPAAAERLQFVIPIPGQVSHMALSHDGSKLAFVSPEENSGLPMLYVQRIGSPTATVLPGTEGASYPFWSPDGTYVAFFANGKLEKMPASGGTPQVLATVLAARGGSWGRRDVIIYAPDAGSAIWRVNADGTAMSQVTTADAKEEASHRWPVFLPDGIHFLFWDGNFLNSKDDRFSGIYLSALDGKEKRLVTLCRSSFGYDSSRLFYADDQQELVSVAFDPSTGAISGSTTAVASSVGFQPSTYWTALAVAQNGTLIYNTSTGAAVSVLTWMDRTGKQLGRIGEPAVMANPTLSPDGSHVAVDISDQKANNVDVWLESTKGTGNARFTFNPEEEVTAVWSRDGNTLAYRANGAGGSVLLLKRASGLERERKIVQVPGTDDLLPNSWSPNDQQILCTHYTSSGSRLELVSVADGKRTEFLTSKGSVSHGMISPNGKWVAYTSDESGNWEIYVTTFPGAAGKWQVSRGGGTEPRWRGDGKEIFDIGSTGMLTAVPVNIEGTFSTGTPSPLFQIHGRAPISSTDVFTYDVTKDGKRFLVNRYVRPDRIAPLTVVLHQAVGQNRTE